MVLSKSFPKGKRLLKTDDFSSVFHFKCGEKAASFRVLARPNGLSVSRLGIIVPKKLVPLSVNRNLIKRLIREEFRHQQHRLSGLDIIVQAHSPGAVQEKSRTVEELRMLMERVRRCLGSL
ncbi:MAG: ribonuclease P protein component [Sulfuricellaceae bacterium]